jgi:NADPH2:quinone reductase
MSRTLPSDSLTSSFARGFTAPRGPASTAIRPGLEVAGSIRELGDGVDGFIAGEPVVPVTGTGAEGGYAAINVVDARFVISLGSSGVDTALAVATVPNAATAYLALTRVAHLQSGETGLVHGALGGLASTFPGVARNLGASTIVGTVRPTSLPVAEASGLPYDQLIGSDEFPNALIDERFDVVIDPVGGDLRTTSLDVMAPLGRLLAVGNASGDWRHRIETNRLWVSQSRDPRLQWGLLFFQPTPSQCAPQPKARSKPSAKASSTFIPRSCRSHRPPNRTAGSKPDR